MDLNQLMAGLGPMQERLRQQEAERAEVRMVGRAGGGAVAITITGDLRVEGVQITPAAATASSDDVGMLEDLIQAALSDALQQYQQRFGGGIDDQVKRAMGDNDIASMLGGLMG